MIVAAVPLKRLDLSKSRLADRLDPGERAKLAADLARRTIRTIIASASVDRVALVSEEGWLAQELGVVALPDAGDLNASLGRAARWASDLGADALLVLPADLPNLQPDEVRSVVASARAPRAVVVAETRDGGTGALLLSPPDVIEPAFGPDSADRHRRLAREAGIQPVAVARPGLEVDLDDARDLANLDVSR